MTLLAPAALYFIFRTAALGVAPGLAAALPPRDASPAVRSALLAAAHPNARVSQDMQEVALRVAVAKPLAFQPYFIAAKAAEQAGKLGKAILLMEEVRRRRPDFLLGRVQLLAYYQRAQATEKLMGELNFVLQRSSEARQYIFPELSKMIGDSEKRRLIAGVLARAPDWRDDFYAFVEKKPPAPQDVGELMNLIRVLRPRGNVAPEQRLYLRSLVARGDFVAARAVAMSFLPEAQRQRHRFVFDPRFSGARGMSPFAWQTATGTNGNAEIISETAGAGYLEVNYFGGSEVNLAGQTLALGNGRHRLSFEAKSPQGISSGKLYWSIECLPSRSELIRLELGKLQPNYRAYQGTFVVPAGRCVGQELRLLGIPGDVSAAVNAQIRNLEVARGE